MVSPLGLTSKEIQVPSLVVKRAQRSGSSGRPRSGSKSASCARTARGKNISNAITTKLRSSRRMRRLPVVTENFAGSVKKLKLLYVHTLPYVHTP